MLSSAGPGGRPPQIAIGNRFICPSERGLATVGKVAGDNLLEIELDDQERRAVGRVLTEGRPRPIEITEDTTQLDPEGSAGSIELQT
jgi:hypothetical protein